MTTEKQTKAVKKIPSSVTKHPLYEKVCKSFDACMDPKYNESKKARVYGWLRGVASVDKDSEFSVWVTGVMVRIKRAQS